MSNTLMLRLFNTPFFILQSSHCFSLLNNYNQQPEACWQNLNMNEYSAMEPEHQLLFMCNLTNQLHIMISLIKK